MNDEVQNLLPKAHVAVKVRSVDASVGFYRKLLGIEPSKHRTGYAKFDVASPPLNLTLNERPFTDSGALFHMGIQVASTNEVLAMRDRWKAVGLETRDEMQIVCGYALQDKSWVTDPDGNQWEVFVVHKDNLPTYYGNACNSNVPACAIEASTEPCCDSTSKPAASSKRTNEEVSKATGSDLAKILELLTAVNLPHDGVSEYLSSFFVVRDQGSRVISCAGLECHGDVGLLRSLAVFPEMQHTGVGSRITSTVIDYAASIGIKEIVLLTTTARDFFVRRFDFAEANRNSYETKLAASPEWHLPRCSSAAVLRLDINGIKTKEP